MLRQPNKNPNHHPDRGAGIEIVSSRELLGCTFYADAVNERLARLCGLAIANAPISISETPLRKSCKTESIARSHERRATIGARDTFFARAFCGRGTHARRRIESGSRLLLMSLIKSSAARVAIGTSIAACRRNIARAFIAAGTETQGGVAMKSSKRNGFPIGWTSISLMVVMTAGASAQTRQAETAALRRPRRLGVAGDRACQAPRQRTGGIDCRRARP